VSATSGRARSRHGVRSGTQGAAGEHFPKIIAVLVTAAAVIVALLATTAAGRAIDAATQRFMLYYAGVFALIGLTASVGIGLVATDRIVLSPGHRVMAQAVHRAVSFGALAFLVIHIVTEILAQRAHVIDAFIPFLSPFRTFYIGLGTIASDLIVLIVVTSILRKRFTAHGKAWRWRAIHYTSYAAFVLGVGHGLLAGRTAKPYVDWSYGFAIALTALGLLVRFLAASLRPKEGLSAPPGADGRHGTTGTSPLRAAALSLAQAQLGGTVRVLPAAAAPGPAVGRPGRGLAELPPAGSSRSSGPFPVIGASPAYAAPSSSPGRDFVPLGAPPYPDRAAAGAARRPAAAEPGRPALAGRGAPGTTVRQPLYEPGYDGPPRYLGAPRRDVPPDGPSSYPYRPRSPRQPAQPGQDDRNSGPLPRAGTGPLPRAGTGPLPRADGGPVPRPGAGSGPLPQAGTGPLPREGSSPGPRTAPRHGSGARPARRPGQADPHRGASRPGGGDQSR